MRLTHSDASVIPDMLAPGVRPISMTAVLLPVSMVSEYIQERDARIDSLILFTNSMIC